MFRRKTVHLFLSLLFCTSVTVFGQWSAANSGTTNNLNGAYLLDSGIAFVVGDAGTIVKTTDAGMTWSPLTSGTTNALHGVYFFDGNQGVAVGDEGLILRTTDGGAMWQSVASGVEDALRSVFFNEANGILGGDSQAILYSTDSGASWQISQSEFFGGGFPGAHMLSPTIGFVAGQNSIFQPLVQATTDGGANWEPHAFYFDKNEGGCTDVRFLNVNTGVVSGFVFDGRGAIARTTDGGTTWSTLFFDQAIEGVDFPVTNTTNLGSLWAGVAESCTPQIWESAGPTRPVGRPQISTTFPSPTTRCEGSQLATAARSSGQQTAVDRGPHQHPLQPLVQHPVPLRQLPLV
jgi:photosystem II stability/assembly factor-like uncharacterized protein